MKESYKIGVVGLWHLGEVYAVGLAELGHDVVGFDADSEVVKNLEKGIPPVAEPNVDTLLVSHLAKGNLRLTNKMNELQDREVIWITFDTPIDENDNPDTTVIFNTLKMLAPYTRSETLIVISSQLPVGTTKVLSNMLSQIRPELNSQLAYVPENLQLGKALESFLKPSRIVIGAENSRVHEKIESVFSGIQTTFLHMNWASAEMAKHALNAFLATSLSFIHDIADLCEVVGADILDVAKALKTDPRIGPQAYLNAGIGFAGGTLGRDLNALLEEGRESNIPLPVIVATREKNLTRRLLVGQKLAHLLGDLKNKTVGILGLTYKPGTPTLRRSLALEIADDIKHQGAEIRAHDPMASPEEVRRRGIAFFEDPYETVREASALVLVTDWPEYKSLDFKKLHAVMKGPAIFFDTKNFLAEKSGELKTIGFHYVGIGR